MTTLERSVDFLIREEEEDEGDGLTLVGHAAVFNQETEINSWEGHFTESIDPGSFKKTLRERTPVLQFDHGRHPLVGSIPIGAIETAREDELGLFVEARLADNWLIQPVRDAIKNKSVNGMSFRFEVVKEKWFDRDGNELRDHKEIQNILWGYDPDEKGPLKRTLKELKVHELGPVVFPAYAGTSVDVRSAEIASLVLSDNELRREVRASLALDRLPQPKSELAEIGPDVELRREVARCLLFGIGEPQPFPKSTEEKEIKPVRDDHLENEDEVRARIQSAKRRMNLRMGYISGDF